MKEKPSQDSVESCDVHRTSQNATEDYDAHENLHRTHLRIMMFAKILKTPQKPFKDFMFTAINIDLWNIMVLTDTITVSYGRVWYSINPSQLYMKYSDLHRHSSQTF